MWRRKPRQAPATIADKSFFPQEWTLDNYEALFEGGLSESPFLAPLINSILIAIIATSIAIVLAAFAAYAIARLDFPGKAVILAGALAIAMFPAISTVGPLFDMWRSLGLYDTYRPAALDYQRFDDGSLHMIPFEFEMEFFWYNTALFEQAGVAAAIAMAHAQIATALNR